MNPGFSIGPIYIHFYGILIMLGVAAAIWLSLIESKRKGEDPEIVLGPGSLAAGGGHCRRPHLAHIDSPGFDAHYDLGLHNPSFGCHCDLERRSGDPWRSYRRFIGPLFICPFQKNQFWMWIDIIAPGLALAQAIGRWGNFVNQELYGSVTTLPWGISIDTNHLVDPYLSMWNANPTFD